MSAEQKHTPEPMRLWRPENDEYPEPHPTDARLVGADGLCYGVLFGMVAEARAMQPRIVACVNACAGMDDPTAEIARLRADMEVHAELQARCFDYGNPTGSSIFDEVRELRAQRDRLLAALNKIASWNEGAEVSGSFDEPGAAGIARAAIAECGGQQP